MSGGVPVGASKPLHELTSKSGKPSSINVGTFGSCGMRSRPATAIGRNLPARRVVVTPEAVLKPIPTCPPMTSFIAGEAPL